MEIEHVEGCDCYDGDISLQARWNWWMFLIGYPNSGVGLDLLHGRSGLSLFAQLLPPSPT